MIYILDDDNHDLDRDDDDHDGDDHDGNNDDYDGTNHAGYDHGSFDHEHDGDGDEMRIVIRNCHLGQSREFFS